MSVSENQAWTEFRAQPNEKNFEAVYRATSPLVYTICRKMLRNEEDALDAFQSSYARILELARTGKGGEDMIAIIRTMAVREADSLRHRRRRKQAREFVDEAIAFAPDPSPGAAERLDKEGRREAVERMLAQLGEEDRIPILLHYFHGMTLREIAEGMNKPLTTIASRVSRGLKKLEPLMRSAGLGEAGAILGTVGLGAELLAPPASVSAAAVFGLALIAPAKATVAGAVAAKLSYMAAALTTKSGIFATGTAFGAMIILALAFSKQEEAKPRLRETQDTNGRIERRLAQASDAPAVGGVTGAGTTQAAPVAPANPLSAPSQPAGAGVGISGSTAPKTVPASDVLPPPSGDEGIPVVTPPEVGILFSQWSAEKTEYNGANYEGWGQGYYAHQYVTMGLRMAGLKPYAIIEPGTLESGMLANALETLKLSDRILDGTKVEELKKVDVILSGFAPNIPDEVVEAIMAAVESGAGFVSIGEFGIENPGNTEELKEFLGIDRSKANFRSFQQNITLETVAPEEFRVGAANAFINGFSVGSLQGFHGVVDGTPLLAVPESIDDAFYPLFVREHGKGRVGVIQSLIAPGGYGGAASSTPSMNILAVRTVVQYVGNWASHRPLTAEWKKTSALDISATQSQDTPTTPSVPARIGLLLSKVFDPRTHWYEITDKQYDAQLATLIAGLETMDADLYPIMEPEALKDDKALDLLQHRNYSEKVVRGDDVQALTNFDLIISFANPKVSTDVLKALHETIKAGGHLAIIGELGAESADREDIVSDLIGFPVTPAGPQVLGSRDGSLIQGVTGRTVENPIWSAGVIRDTSVLLDGTLGYGGVPADAEPLIVLNKESIEPFWPAYVRTVGSGTVVTCQFIRINTSNDKAEARDIVETYQDMYGWIVRLVESARE